MDGKQIARAVELAAAKTVEELDAALQESVKEEKLFKRLYIRVLLITWAPASVIGCLLEGAYGFHLSTVSTVLGMVMAVLIALVVSMVIALFITASSDSLPDTHDSSEKVSLALELKKHGVIRSPQ